GVMPDAIPNSESQVVILQDESKTNTLPIWVGVAEGTAIRLALESVVPPRPLSHDLIRNLTEQLGLTISKVVVTDVKNNTYYASIFLRSKQSDKQSELTVDSRPSDAIALALRTSCPIYVTQEVLDHLAPENIDPWLKILGSKEFGGTVQHQERGQHDENLFRQEGGHHAQVVPGRCEWEDAGPLGLAGRDRAPGQAQAGLHPARGHGRPRDRR